MDAITLKVTGTLRGPLEQMKKDLPKAEAHALYKAAYFLRDKIRQSLTTAIPKATQKNPKYNDTLVDAVGFTKVDGASLTVNAMGNRKTGSGTYRTRFFEEGTRERYQKTYKGIRLKKKKYIGKIGATKFFSSAVQANQNAAIQLMQQVIEKYVDTAFSKA